MCNIFNISGAVSSIRHLKNEVSSINTNVECGIMLEDTEVRFESGDKLICFTWKKKKQYTDWNPPGF